MGEEHKNNDNNIPKNKQIVGLICYKRGNILIRILCGVF